MGFFTATIKEKYAYRATQSAFWPITFYTKPFVASFIGVSKEGFLHVHAGYACDGCTGVPKRIEQRFGMVHAAFMHDALYQAMRLGHIPKQHRQQADYLLYVHWLSDGVPKPMATAGYAAVRALGWMFI